MPVASMVRPPSTRETIRPSEMAMSRTAPATWLAGS